MNKQISRIADINCDNIVFTKPIKVSENKFKIRIFYKNNNEIGKMTTVLPTLFCCDPVENNEIILTLNTKNQIVENDNSLLLFLNKLDEKITNEITKNAKQLNLKAGNIEYESIFSDIESDNKLHQPGIIKLSLLDTDNFKTKLFDTNRTLIDKDEYANYINGNCYIKSIIEFNTLDIDSENSKINLVVVPHQLKILPGIENMQIEDYAFSETETL